MVLISLVLKAPGRHEACICRDGEGWLTGCDLGHGKASMSERVGGCGVPDGVAVSWFGVHQSARIWKAFWALELSVLYILL